MKPYRDGNGEPRIGLTAYGRLLRRLRYWECGLYRAQLAIREYNKKHPLPDKEKE